MATRDDIRKRIQQINPAALELIDRAQEMARSMGHTETPVITTEDMTEDEMKMAIYEALLKDGRDADTAERETEKRWSAITGARQALDDAYRKRESQQS